MLARHLLPVQGNTSQQSKYLLPNSVATEPYWPILLHEAATQAWQHHSPEAVLDRLRSCLYSGEKISALDWLIAHRAMDLPAHQKLCQKALQTASPAWQTTGPICLAIDTGMQMLNRDKSAPWLQKLDLAAMLGVWLGQSQHVELWAYGSQVQSLSKAGSLPAQALRLRQADTGWQSKPERILDQRTPTQTLIYLSTGPAPEAVWSIWDQVCAQPGQPWLVWLQLSDSRAAQTLDRAHHRLKARGNMAVLLKQLKAQGGLNWH